MVKIYKKKKLRKITGISVCGVEVFPRIHLEPLNSIGIVRL